VKANLLIFFIIAVIAFCISSAFATLTIHEDNDSYKLLSLDNDSFEPNHINYVPTIIPKNDTNTTTNSTNTTDLDYDDNDTDETDDIETTIDNWTDDDYEWDEYYLGEDLHE
jgi:hypothetical protein